MSLCAEDYLFRRAIQVNDKQLVLTRYTLDPPLVNDRCDMIDHVNKTTCRWMKKSRLMAMSAIDG